MTAHWRATRQLELIILRVRGVDSTANCPQWLIAVWQCPYYTLMWIMRGVIWKLLLSLPAFVCVCIFGGVGGVHGWCRTVKHLLPLVIDFSVPQSWPYNTKLPDKRPLPAALAFLRLRAQGQANTELKPGFWLHFKDGCCSVHQTRPTYWM